MTSRRDSVHELYVAVLSNAFHLAADTGRVITCPFIPGRLPDSAMAMVVAVERPRGTLLPELVQWLPRAALDEPMGTIGATALRETQRLSRRLLLTAEDDLRLLHRLVDTRPHLQRPGVVGLFVIDRIDHGAATVRGVLAGGVARSRCQRCRRNVVERGCNIVRQ